jgi:glutamate 5-kinase
VWRDLGAAEDCDLIAFDGPRVRFSHPLLAHGAYSRATRSDRREMHRHASALVVDPEERARHLAAAAHPREAVPALDVAARHVRARGAPETAAELLELALELGGGDELRVRAAEHHLDAGDPTRARATLEEAVRVLPAGPARAQALLLLGEVRYKSDSFSASRAVFEDARDEIGDREPDRVMLELRIAYVLGNLGLLPPAAELTRAALAHARALEEPALLAQALAVAVMLDFNLGRGLDEARLTEALDLEDHDQRTTSELQPSLIAAFLFLWTGRFGEASALLDAMTARSEDRGETHALVWAQGYLRVWLQCWTGDLEAASRTAEEGFARLLELGVVPIVNENDTVATSEIRFGDNDRLAALVSHLVHADRLVLLSDVDGLYDGDPAVPGSQIVADVRGEQDLAALNIVRPSASAIGTGGMVTKVEAARIATGTGIPVVLTSAPHAAAALAGERIGTAFHPTGRRRSMRLLWIAHASDTKGSVHLDAGAVRALTLRKASLLPAGITSVSGTFAAGDPVDLVGPDGVVIARGIVNYDSSEVPELMGRSTHELAATMGAEYERVVVHRDDLVLI